MTKPQYREEIHRLNMKILDLEAALLSSPVSTGKEEEKPEYKKGYAAGVERMKVFEILAKEHQETGTKYWEQILSLQSKEKELKDCLRVQDEYIEFLGKEIERTSTYLHVHNMGCSSEIAAKGLEMRELITKAKQLIQ
jgi:hypothetical protein